MQNSNKKSWINIIVALSIISLMVISSFQISSVWAQTPNGTNTVKDTFWWGAIVSDTAWGNIGTSSSYSYGSFFGDTQINLMQQNGATAFRIMLDKKPWDLNDNKNVYGLIYKDYIKQLVDDCHSRGVKVILDLTRDSSMGEEFDTTGAKAQVIKSSSLRSAWIDWGMEVVSHCRPDAIGIMNEPRGDVTFDYYYDNFLIPSINAYRSVDSNIDVFVMSMPFYSIEKFTSRPINDDKVFYGYHLYYRYPETDSSPSFIAACDAYGKGRLLEAKTYLYQYLDSKFSGISKNKIIFGEVGPYEYSDAVWVNGLPDPVNTPNWDVFLQDMCSYAVDKGIKGSFQYAIAKYRYIMLDPRTGYTTFSPYGAVWDQISPTIPTPSPTPIATATPTPIATATPTPIATATPTPIATATPTPNATATPTPTSTLVPSPILDDPSSFMPLSPIMREYERYNLYVRYVRY